MPPRTTSAASSIADNRLGLSAQDVATLRQHQQLAHSQARSPAGSQASSQGRLLLDPGSLQMLTRHFDRVMQAIHQRLEQVRNIIPWTPFDNTGCELGECRADWKCPWADCS